MYYKQEHVALQVPAYAHHQYETGDGSKVDHSLNSAFCYSE